MTFCSCYFKHRLCICCAELTVICCVVAAESQRTWCSN